VENGEMILNTLGCIVRDCWEQSAEIRSEIELDEFVIMPNHFHAIVWLVETNAPRTNAFVGAQHTETTNTGVGAHGCAPEMGSPSSKIDVIQPDNDLLSEDLKFEPQNRAHSRAPLRSRPKSLSTLMAQFKATSTREINRTMKTPGFRLWQRNYYDHVIRNEPDLNRVQYYIVNNPATWAEDEENPRNLS
jgi:putative transposase